MKKKVLTVVTLVDLLVVGVTLGLSVFTTLPFVSTITFVGLLLGIVLTSKL